MRPFGCLVTILNTLDPLGKFQGKVDEGFLVGYSICSKAFRSVSPDIHSSSCGDETKEQGDKTKNKDKGKSPVVTVTGFRDLNEEFTECIKNSSNGVSAVGPSVSAAGLDFTNNTNNFSAASPSNAAMPNLEDPSHDADDVGAEADTNNMESIISVSPIPTTIIHKDHPTSQIVGDLSSTTQTRNESSWIGVSSVSFLAFEIESVRIWLYEVELLLKLKVVVDEVIKRLFQERIRAPPDSCMIPSSTHRLDQLAIQESECLR
nr:retrovirus-related Pol polyprotein from transposon TNT 1-94 [Tanacetum cinerariifolium]